MQETYDFRKFLTKNSFLAKIDVYILRNFARSL